MYVIIQEDNLRKNKKFVYQVSFQCMKIFYLKNKYFSTHFLIIKSVKMVNYNSRILTRSRYSLRVIKPTPSKYLSYNLRVPQSIHFYYNFKNLIKT